ncbi:hypothetical protein ACFX15_013222 [Malus domestica]
MSSSTKTNDGEHEVELIVHNPSASGDDGGMAVADEIVQLLTQPEKPKINIFILPYPRGTSKDQSIPLLKAAFTRCTIILVLSFVWLRKCGEPVSGLAIGLRIRKMRMRVKLWEAL